MSAPPRTPERAARPPRVRLSLPRPEAAEPVQDPPAGRLAPVIGGCLALALLTLVAGGAPTYDPWAWIIWGREIAEGTLATTEGPSWKPLPVLFTTPFSLLGDGIAPDAWLVISRAGAMLALVMAFRLASRIAGPWAGAVAAVALLFSEDFVRHAARGNSEALLIGLALLAVERHLDGRRSQAFALAFAAALLRPEVWPFFGLYGLWLARAPGRRALVAACFAAMPLLWLVPEWIGSGNLLRAADRARAPNPDSPAFAAHPFLEVFDRSSTVVAIPVLAGAAVAVVLLRRNRLLMTLAACAAVLMVAVALMTEAGFAGNLRYVALPAALVCVLAGAGWAAVARHGPVPAVLCLLAVAPFAPGLAVEMRDDFRSMRSEATFEGSLVSAIDAAGGRARVNSCGGVFTGRFQVPVLAWHLGRHIEEVEIFAFPPGYTVAGRFTPLSRDPRFAKVAETRKWIVGRNCAGPDPLAP